MTSDDIARWKRQVREISDWIYERQPDGVWGAPRDEYDRAAIRVLSGAQGATSSEECMRALRSVFGGDSSEIPFPLDADGEWLLTYLRRGGLSLEYSFDEAAALAVAIAGETELETTLNDAVSALAPAGHPTGLTTYWIDHAIRRIEEGVEEIASGNMSTLLRDDSVIKPCSDYIDWPERAYPAFEILGLLRAWRQAVLELVQEPGELEDDTV